MKNNLFLAKRAWIVLLVLCWQAAAPAQTPDFPVLDTLPALDSLPEADTRAFARQLARQAFLIRDIYSLQADRAVLDREVAADQLAAAEADTLATKEERQTLGKALKSYKNAEKEALKQLKKADKALELVTTTAELDSAALRKNLPKAYKAVAALIPPPAEPEETPIAGVIGVVGVSEPVDLVEAAQPADTAAVEMPAEEEAAPKKEKGKDRKKDKEPARPVFKKYNPAEDPMLNPPTRPCVLTLDTRDAFSGERRRETAKEELFRFTNPALKAYFPDREHIVCQASMSMNGGTHLLSLHFTINDPNAKRAFGNLPRNGIAILKLLNGDTYTLYNLRLDEGTPGQDQKTFSFTGQYVVEPGVFKKMQKSLLDKIRIAWATGYEDYDVQNVDFLTRQLSCLLGN